MTQIGDQDSSSFVDPFVIDPCVAISRQLTVAAKNEALQHGASDTGPPSLPIDAIRQKPELRRPNPLGVGWVSGLELVFPSLLARDNDTSPLGGMDMSDMPDGLAAQAAEVGKPVVPDDDEGAFKTMDRIYLWKSAADISGSGSPWPIEATGSDMASPCQSSLLAICFGISREFSIARRARRLRGRLPAAQTGHSQMRAHAIRMPYVYYHTHAIVSLRSASGAGGARRRYSGCRRCCGRG